MTPLWTLTFSTISGVSFMLSSLSWSWTASFSWVSLPCSMVFLAVLGNTSLRVLSNTLVSSEFSIPCLTTPLRANTKVCSSHTRGSREGTSLGDLGDWTRPSPLLSKAITVHLDALCHIKHLHITHKFLFWHDKTSWNVNH